MNKTQLIVIVVVCLVLGGLSVYLAREEKKEFEAVASVSKRGLIDDLDVNKVAKVRIAKDDQSVTIRKTGDEWTVAERADYPADFNKLRDAVVDLKNLKRAQTVEVPETELATLELEKPGAEMGGGTRVELLDEKDGELLALRLGKTHEREPEPGANPFFSGAMPDGRFLILENGAKQVHVVSDPLRAFTANPTGWLDQSFIAIKKIQSLTLRRGGKDQNWQMKKEDEKGEFQLLDVPEGREPDSGKIRQIASALQYFNFTDVLPAETKTAETGLDKADYLVVETFNHCSYELKLSSAKGKRFCAVRITTEIPAKRAPEADEKPEEKEKRDKVFEEKKVKLEGKRDKEKFFEKWIYEIPKSKYETLVVSKSDLTKKAEKSEGKSAATPKPVPAAKNGETK